MKMVWRSTISRSSAQLSVEAVPPYGSECWTMNTSLQKSPDASYTRLLMSTGATTFSTVTSMETSPRFQTKSLGGDSGLWATVIGTRSSLRTTLFCGSQLTESAVQEDPQQHLWTPSREMSGRPTLPSLPPAWQTVITGLPGVQPG